jgi:hypothetical protein
MILYFQELQDLGKYKIEKAEDYDDAKKDGLDTSFYEMIRVRGSKSEQGFPSPSAVSKYSNDSLILYLKDHKRYWGRISRILNQEIDLDGEEAVFVFPYQKFYQIDKILHFVRKRSRQTEMTIDEKEKARQNMAKINSNKRHIIENFNQNLNEKRLDDYLVKVEK